MKIINLSSNKGGVGVTTTTLNIAKLLANQFNYEVLLIDMNQNCNLTDLLEFLESDSDEVDWLNSKFSLDNNKKVNSIYDVLLSNAAPETVIKKTAIDSLYLIRNCDSCFIEIESQYVLRKWLMKHENRIKKIWGIDLVIIDSSCGKDSITKNAYNAANDLIAIVTSNQQSIDGLKFFHNNYPENCYVLINNIKENDFISEKIIRDLKSNVDLDSLSLLKAKIKYHEQIEQTMSYNRVHDFENVQNDKPQSMDGYLDLIQELLGKSII